MEPALIGLLGLLGTLAGHWIAVRFKTTEQRRGQLEKLALLMTEIAACLTEMEKELRIGNPPTEAGNRLTRILENYRKIIEAAPLEQSERDQILADHFRVERCLLSGRAEDDFLRGKILYRAESERDAALREMSRIAGRLQGEAATLRAAA